MKILAILVLSALVAFLSGCATGTQSQSTGREIDPTKVSQIVKGATTRAEIEALLGKPEMTALVGDGKRMMSYNYSATNFKTSVMLTPFMVSRGGTKGTVRTQTLQIFLSKDGVVEDYEFNDNLKDVEGDLRGNMKSTNR